MALMHFNTNKV